MKQKTALVTGASKGIGLAITEKLLNEGWRVIGVARSFSLDLPGSFIPYPINMEDLDSLPNSMKELKKEHPHLDVIICNAGKGVFGCLEEFSLQNMRSVLDLNFLSHAYLVQTFLPSFKRKKEGKIIFIGSEAALQGKKMGSIYCASKFAIRGFAQALREECATSNIGISLINPGMVSTDFFTNLSFEPGENPLEHILPKDVAEAVLLVLNMRNGTVLDEICLSPQKKCVRFKSKQS